MEMLLPGRRSSSQRTAPPAGWPSEGNARTLPLCTSEPRTLADFVVRPAACLETGKILA